MKRPLQLLCLLLLLAFPFSACSESLRACTTKEAVLAMIDFPREAEDGSTREAAVRAGRIRFIPQSLRDPLFVKSYWLGGAEGSSLDLTQTEDSKGREYDEYCGVMCTRACYSMALSYFGVDVTPGGMSAMLGERSIDSPYDEITEKLYFVERVKGVDYRSLDEMMDRYLSDPTYSPVLITLLRPNGIAHALLAVGRDEEGRLLVIDPAPYELRGTIQRVQYLRPTANRQKVYSCTISSYEDSLISGCYQWHWTGSARVE